MEEEKEYGSRYSYVPEFRQPVSWAYWRIGNKQRIFLRMLKQPPARTAVF
jgi:hypothetical protein